MGWREYKLATSIDCFGLGPGEIMEPGEKSHDDRSPRIYTLTRFSSKFLIRRRNLYDFVHIRIKLCILLVCIINKKKESIVTWQLFILLVYLFMLHYLLANNYKNDVSPIQAFDLVDRNCLQNIAVNYQVSCIFERADLIIFNDS